MTGTVIALIIIGLIFIFASFFISEAVSDSVKEEKAPAEVDITLSDLQKEKLQQEAVQGLRETYENAVYQFDEQLSALSNEKTMALGDYAVSVCDEIEKNHKEAMFLYSMLGDKEKELKMLVEQVDELKQEIKSTVSESKQAIAEAVQVEEKEAAKDSFEAEIQTMDDMDADFDSAEQEQAEPDADNANELILELKKSGMGIIEIAKQLGLGVGEVKLVVDLYESGK